MYAPFLQVRIFDFICLKKTVNSERKVTYGYCPLNLVL